MHSEKDVGNGTPKFGICRTWKCSQSINGSESLSASDALMRSGLSPRFRTNVARFHGELDESYATALGQSAPANPSLALLQKRLTKTCFQTNCLPYCSTVNLSSRLNSSAASSATCSIMPRSRLWMPAPVANTLLQTP